MIKLGVPEEQLGIVRAIDTLDALYRMKASIPEDAYEGLEWIANGFEISEVLELLAEDKQKIINNDFVAALQTPRSQKSFVIVEGEQELRQILAEPLEKWRVFLHPTQRKIVQKNFTGSSPCSWRRRNWKDCRCYA